MNAVGRQKKFNNIDLEDIIDLSADAIISVDEKQEIVLFNAAAVRIFGYAEDEILGQHLNVLLPRSIHQKHAGYMETFNHSDATSRPMGLKKDLFGITKSGEAVPLDITIQKHPKGRFCKFTAICRDLRHRLDQEKRVRENEAKFIKLFNTSQQYIMLVNGQGDVLEFNDTLKEFIKDDVAHFIGAKIWECEFWSKEVDRELVQNSFSEALCGKNIPLVASISGKKSKTLVLDMTISLVPLGEDQSQLIVLEGKDITGLLNTNEALLESELRLMAAQKIAHLGNWEWNILSNKLIWSDEIYRIFGAHPEEFEATYEAFLGFVHPDDRHLVDQAVIEALEKDMPYRIVHRIVLHDGTEKIVEERAEVLRSKDDCPVKMRGTVQDISNRWKREQELYLAKQHAEDANIAKAQFLSAVSHELRTPLNAIIGFSSMIAEEQLGEMSQPEYLEYAQYINTSGQNLLEMINNILDVTSYELGSIKFQPSYFSAQSLLEKSLTHMSKKAEEKKIIFETTIKNDIPELYLDEKYTQQMLAHLLGNAIKFSKKNDTIKVNLDYLENEFLIEVIDQGVGLDEDDLETMFDLFVSKDMGFSRIHGGVGLGLNIVKNLAELQGGRVQARSNSDKGSCFSLYFTHEKIDAKYQN